VRFRDGFADESSVLVDDREVYGETEARGSKENDRGRVGVGANCGAGFGASTMRCDEPLQAVTMKVNASVTRADAERASMESS